jgi:GTP-binding protein EngB required for normal cell division
VTGGRHRGADALLARAEALHWFLEAVDGVAPEERIGPARAVVARARERLELSRGHTVVALAGATGGGKSSLFNAVCRLALSDVGVRRPTTAATHACVWGMRDSDALLDWLGIPADLRFARESALDADDEAPLRGLVLLDLPDFDSVAVEHRAEVDRLLGLVDLVIWITDPQKYADQVMHRDYLRAFHRYRDVMAVVLNQADRLSPGDATRCVTDLRHLLESDGLAGVPVFATSVVAEPGIGELRGVLEKAVSARQAALRRLDDDLTTVMSGFAGLVGPEPAERGAEEALVDALVQAAGVAAVADAAARGYRHRAARWLRWLPVLPPWRRRIEVPGPVPAQPARTGLAVRGYGERVGAGLPEPWPAELAAAARSHLAELPGALDRALTGTDIGVSRTPWWWSVARAAQWLLAAVALCGLGWLAAAALAPAFGASGPGDPVPAALLMVAGALVAGLLLRVLLLPLAVSAARVVHDNALRRLRASVFEVARQQVVEPVRVLLGRYARASAALAGAGSVGDDDTDDSRRTAGAATAHAGTRAGHP